MFAVFKIGRSISFLTTFSLVSRKMPHGKSITLLEGQFDCYAITKAVLEHSRVTRSERSYL